MERMERIKITRPDRIKLVLGAMSKPPEWKSKQEIADETGLSVGLVTSTINLIQRVTEGDDDVPTVLTYNLTGGWAIAETWDQKVDYVQWLQKHIATRLSTLREQVDVAIAAFGDDVPATLALTLKLATRALDDVQAELPSPKEAEEISGPARVELYS